MIADGTRVEFDGAPTPDQAVAVFREVFPHPGKYFVQPMIKAEAVIGEGFEEWFMRTLDGAVQGGFKDSKTAIWSVLDDMLIRRGLTAPSQIDHWELQQALFDLTH